MTFSVRRISRAAFAALICCFAAFTLGYRSDASTTNYTVTFRYGGDVALTQPETQMLYSNTIEMLKTSNFNSSQPKTQAWPEFQTQGIQNDYKATVSGDYLIISLNEEETFKTLGGAVRVKEIVMGLDNGHGRDELFTIDSSQHIISHGKYSGPIWMTICQAAQKIAKPGQN